MIFEMCIIPQTTASARATTITQSLTLFASLLVCLVMLDAIRRINKLRGKHLILSVWHIALLFSSYFLFLASGAFYIYLFHKPPKSDKYMLWCYLLELIIDVVGQITFLTIVY